MALVAFPSSAPPPPAVTPEAVKVALQELLAAAPGNNAISTADPVIEPGALELILKPLTTAQLKVEMGAGRDVLQAGVSGEVEKVSHFSTHLSTSENRKVIVPNNKIWEDVIVNSTGADTRRLALDVEVNAKEHSIEEAEMILRAAMVAHPDVLKDPEPGLDLTGVSADSYTFSCRPWVRTEQRDRLKWDLVSQFGRKPSVVKS
jgi:small-conductance mechanosensitive channel